MGFMATWNGRKAYRLHIKGNALDDKKQYEQAERVHDQALALYRQAMDEGFRKPNALMAYAVLLMRKGRFEEAREVMLTTEKQPGLSRDDRRKLELNFAICQWRRGQLEGAIELMKHAHEDAKQALIYGSLGYMLIEKAIQTGDFAEAVAFNQEAYEYDEDDAVVLDNLGQLALAQGERERARGFFERALAQKPTQVDTLYYLAKLSCEDGDSQAAESYLARALGGRYSALCTTTREQAEALMERVKGG